jgi:hypothetical protein
MGFGVVFVPELFQVFFLSGTSASITLSLCGRCFQLTIETIIETKISKVTLWNGPWENP